MENNKRPTQAQRILFYMRDFGSITQLQALSDLGCFRLASRISELKKDGHEINKRMIKGKNRYGEICSVAEYSLKECAEQ